MKNKLSYHLFFIFSLLFLGVNNPLLAAVKTDPAMQQTVKIAEKININSATIPQLTVIKGIGDKKAQAIIDYREAEGDFSFLSELVNVNGIGESTLKKMTPFIIL